MKPNELKNLLETNSTLVENALSLYFKTENELFDIMSYSLFAGGKRIRPFIAIEVFKAFSKTEVAEKVLPFACALEMIHTYSLIHDDLPCMDDDDYRRGIPTSHKVYGEAKALLAGDTLLTHAFEIATSNSCVSDKSARLAIKVLAQCSGAFGMAGGQMIDLDSKNKILSYEALKEMYALKTGALLKCAALLGYYAYTDTPDKCIEQALSDFAINLGIAFQLRDDVLDVISTKDVLGKNILSDEKNGKTTALSFLSLEMVKNDVKAYTEKALNSLNKCFDKDADVLKAISLYLVEREK